MKNLIVALGIVLTSVAHAETFQGIQFDWKLADIKAAFPNSKIEFPHPAWEQKNERLLHMTGKGISGTIVILLRHADYNSCIKSVDNLYEGKSLPPDTALKRLCDIYRNQKGVTPENAGTVDYIRWIPDPDINIESYYQKFGKPDTVYFDEDMTKTADWKRKGIAVGYLEYSGLVGYVTYTQSKQEVKNAITNLK